MFSTWHAKGHLAISSHDGEREWPPWGLCSKDTYSTSWPHRTFLTSLTLLSPDTVPLEVRIEHTDWGGSDTIWSSTRWDLQHCQQEPRSQRSAGELAERGHSTRSAFCLGSGIGHGEWLAFDKDLSKESVCHAGASLVLQPLEVTVSLGGQCGSSSQSCSFPAPFCSKPP